MTRPDSAVRPHREVVSFVRRSARMNPSQERAWREHRGPTSSTSPRGDHVDVRRAAGRRSTGPRSSAVTAPTIVEIGAGNGDSLVATAVAHPDTDIVGFEVFEPSIASTVGKLAAARVTNARIVLGRRGPGAALPRTQWLARGRTRLLPGPLAQGAPPQAAPAHPGDLRAHRRPPAPRRRAARRDRLGGLRARDARGARRVGADQRPRPFDRLSGRDWAPRFEERPLTKYETRGLAAGRTVYDLCYRR